MFPKTTLLSYLALGDSYTIGEAVLPNQRWSEQLVQKLKPFGIDFSTLDIIAKTGFTTAELVEAIHQQNLSQTYDLVSLLIGVNNQYRGQSLEQFGIEFRQLLATSTQLAGNSSRVFVLSIPDWGVSPFAQNLDNAKIAHEIDAFNKLAKEECNLLGIRFLDITPLSRKALNDTTMIANDDLHFSEKMYKLWADFILETVRKMIAGNVPKI